MAILTGVRWWLFVVSCLAILLVYYYCLAMLGLCRCVWAFSSCEEQGLLFVVKWRLLVMVTPTLTLSQPPVLGTYGLLGKWILFKQKKNPVSRIIILSNPHFAQVFLRIDISPKVAKCSAQCQVQRSLLFSLKQKGFKYILPSWQQWQMGLQLKWITDGLSESHKTLCK